MAKKKAKGSAGLNKKSGEALLEKYQNKPDSQITDSGLIYRVIETSENKNISPSMLDTVVIHQRIMLADGSVIADSYKAGLPEEFAMREAIEGLQQGLSLMKIGERFEFIIPPALAWGKKGNSGKIGPNAVLHFDVRLIRVI
ncbi:FKBP-type peptidyl-prolyl cis-trans isomerase [Catenovulum sediminis]|uniref:FKBP-type peptidyl-prolyl cis-trans isomerase n=1 Tax=Catenovulum sediminis TaxID=1740262 RepID=UPI00117EEE14|nr:FKBP-type peptidyl-prolyl cis-trans isomerase [Catenovulum sediminis]